MPPPFLLLMQVSAGGLLNRGSKPFVGNWMVLRDPAPVAFPLKRVVAHLTKREAYARFGRVFAPSHGAVNVTDSPVPFLMGLLVDLAHNAAVSVPSTNAPLRAQFLFPWHSQTPKAPLHASSST